MIIFNQAVRRIMKNKIRLLILLIMPILFIMMFAMQESRTLTIGLVDQDKSALSKKLTAELEGLHQVKVELLDESAVYNKTVSYQIDYTLIIESGFESQIIQGEQPQLQEFYLNEKEKLFIARNVVENFIGAMTQLAAGADYDKEQFDAVLKEYENSALGLTNESNDGRELYQARAAMGFLVQFMLYMSVITAGLVSEDKQSGVFYRIFYAPVTLRRYIIENLAAFLIVGIAQVTIIMALLTTVFNVSFGSSPIPMYLLFVLFSIVCICFGLWIVSLFQKPLGAYITVIFLTTPLVMLGGCYWNKEFMPDIFQNIALFLPTTWVMDSVERILYEGSSISDLSLEIMILFLFAGIFLAAGLFKKVDVSQI
jgi:ABC-2 type transport system permease protein